MKNTTIAVITIIITIAILVPFMSDFFEEKGPINKKPSIEIIFPIDGDTVSKIVTISGSATDPDGDQTIKQVEILINDSWIIVDGTTLWSYTWTIYNLNNSNYNLSVRAWDGAVYSDIKSITINIFNPEIVESDEHKWAVFIFASNFPVENESKLGNGGLFLAEEMAEFLIEEKNYPTSNIIILFDDGWIRKDNGYGNRLEPLQQRFHKYDITYEGATRENVEATLKNIVQEVNSYEDSEVFIWLAGHGYGDSENPVTGGKFFENCGIFLWDSTILTDKDLGNLLSNLASKRTCVVVDGCYSGGFADKTILSFPEFFLFKSEIPKPGRVIITGTSKFRVGYASTTRGPLFSLVWFEGITSGKADGYRPGFFEMGRPSRLQIFKDGKISVEEAFYYARYVFKNDESYKDFRWMEPQINDQYPRNGPFRSLDGLILGE